jgi:hypothetical protein
MHPNATATRKLSEATFFQTDAEFSFPDFGLKEKKTPRGSIFCFSRETDLMTNHTLQLENFDGGVFQFKRKHPLFVVICIHIYIVVVVVTTLKKRGRDFEKLLYLGTKSCGKITLTYTRALR